ncbi:MAG: alpha-mannosidase, partial [Anaerolineae bacterium]|nr:alpha-mannosidase [Anaerolineae bacterium]
LTVQAVEGGTLVEFADIQPYSVVSISEGISEAQPSGRQISATQNGDVIVLENDLLRVEFNGSGDITRVYDKQVNREVLAPDTTANALQAFEDRPMNFDAWDIDIFYEDRTEKIEGVESITITEQGPIRVALDVQRKYRSSTIHQKIYLYRDSKRLDFDTWIDWHEHHTLLKVAFPVDVMSPMATFDVQWGNVQRPTHSNTSWDWARFETCAHKWADLSEGNYGVAILNDCKYGHDIHDNVLRLTLLKSATSPDPNADQGEHYMTYSLLPHEGDWRKEVVPAAYDLNNPLILRHVSGGTASSGSLESLVSVSATNVVIETIKRAEDGNDIIVRLYENERNRGMVSIKTGFALAKAQHCNLLEENDATLSVQDNQVQFEIKPYEIVTLRLTPQA